MQKIKFFLAFFSNVALVALGHVLFLKTFWLAPISILVIGRGLFGLGALGHELRHGSVFKSTMASETLAALCFNLLKKSSERYWQLHKQHHIHYLNDKDSHRRVYGPVIEKYFVDLSSKKEFLVNLLRYILDFRLFFMHENRVIHSRQKDTKKSVIDQPLLVCGASLVLIFFSLGPWNVLLHLVAFFVGLRLIDILRVVSEHDVRTDDEFLLTRDYDGGALMNFLWRPHNINFHIMHHIDPSMPCWELKKGHERYRTERPVFDGYFFGKRTLVSSCLKGRGN